ncbi:hypothetical protein LCGC14_1314590 [marine sediment metagenome]|uniref:Uncharacterized protein n=1 Tax=marine sediment metagenome TaxID=412755 RepID=A0A0F9KLB3_9ZZZZ
MMTSKLFLGVWLIAGLMIATSMWEGNTVAMSIGAAVVSGALVGAFVKFMWDKVEPRL